MGLSTVEGLKEVSATINETLQKEEITMANLRRKAPKGMKTMREYKAGLKRDDNIMQAKMKRISPKPKPAPLRKPPRIKNRK